MYHYVYLLTNKEDKRHYIGVRTSSVTPKQDPYMSSCKKVTKDYLLNCKKTILRIFDSRKEACAYEVLLHNKYDVGINPKFFNGAKQTSTKFDQTGLISDKHNPNAKTINIYDHLGILRHTLVGELTNWNADVPKNAFVKSHKLNGLPVGYSRQSRIELRKRMHQYYIGWYALVDGEERKHYSIEFDINKERNTGLSSKLTSYKLYKYIKEHNPNAKTYEVRNEQGELLATVTGNLLNGCKELFGMTSHVINTALSTGKPIPGLRGTTTKWKGWTVTKKEKT